MGCEDICVAYPIDCTKCLAGSKLVERKVEELKKTDAGTKKTKDEE